jgi:hypothetical protein
MHAINIRCMVKQFGSLRNCPDTVTATLVEMEPVSMDEVMCIVVGVSLQIVMLVVFMHNFKMRNCSTITLLNAKTVLLQVSLLGRF